MKTSPGIIRELQPNQVFVFGSNTEGRHGRGAAKTAKQWGARNGVGEGLMGQTYGIATKETKGKHLVNRSLSDIKKSVHTFLEFARQHPELEFLVTEIGCGLAKFTPGQIAPLFVVENFPKNVVLPKRFVESIEPLFYS